MSIRAATPAELAGAARDAVALVRAAALADQDAVIRVLGHGAEPALIAGQLAGMAWELLLHLARAHGVPEEQLAAWADEILAGLAAEAG